ncbi:MAG: amidohydrolase family protein [Ruminococcus sp.]|nr:amidohydrolase family protein [Ruminococcus sp.]MCM1479716.1 amidohydrolase family protein [Muribaculaceae bacterium]
MYFYNAKIYPSSADFIPHGFVEAEDGKIIRVSGGTPLKIGEGDVDVHGLRLYPGFVDIHTHMGLIGDGQGAEGEDVNEDSDPVTPHLRTVDGLCHRDGYFADAVRAGVTCVVTGVGSSNPIGGDLIAVHTAGRSADEMLIKRVGIKFALGENPKSTFADKDAAPVTRMATAAVIREALFKAQRYRADKISAEENGENPPEFDMKSEALIPLLNGELKAHFHCHRADDILTAVRIAEEFGLEYVLIHCTEGHFAADILGEKGAAAVVGPILCDRGKPELAGQVLENGAVLSANGVRVAVCTDHPETPIQYLLTSAAYCVKAGLPRAEGIRAVTSTAAEIAGIGDLVGDIAPGLSADFALLDGDPFDIMTNVRMTVIKGEIAFSINN